MGGKVGIILSYFKIKLRLMMLTVAVLKIDGQQRHFGKEEMSEGEELMDLYIEWTAVNERNGQR